MTMNSILEKLEGTNRRSIGRVNDVVTEVLRAPELCGDLIAGLANVDAVLRMRCADALEKISAVQPAFIQPYKAGLLKLARLEQQQEVRWHLALMFGRLKLTAQECQRAYQILLNYLNDQSRIVKTFAMQGLAELAEQDARLRPAIVKQLGELMRTGSPAMRARGRLLLDKLKAV